MGIDEMRAWAFEIFDKTAEALLMLVSDTESADAFCEIVPVLKRAAFREYRVGRPQQYCTPFTLEALFFERGVARRIEVAKMNGI